MASFRITITGNRLRNLDQRVRDRLRQVVGDAAQNVETRAVEAIEGGTKSGRSYAQRGRTHLASAPGQAPANDTGELAGSIRMEMIGELSARVVVESEHGPVLELGGVNVAARPFLGPALEAERSAFEAAVRQAVEDELR